ncbi:hypothetical protein [Rhodohalobacter sp.]|uniref:hypothetical protein n=1 Tax=Rhodohalobacter sp. TaxID=1974210 RepID=UPI002ACDAF89|nr:hypothetical protein [Rhodohalobacter sp.]MDZ7757460.1 hypothetical protein [Rhodohalobacter sp.]
MKKALVGSLIGVAIVVALDSFARVIISIYMGLNYPMISYSEFPGIIWPMLLTLIGGFSVFFGAMFTLTYGRSHRLVALLNLLFFIILLRYGQIYLLTGIESLFYPITTLVLSLGSILLAWQLTDPKKNSAPQEVKEESDLGESHQDYHKPQEN